MAFDANRDIVEDLINNILRGVEVPDPLLDAEVAAELEQLNFDFDDEADFNEDADDYDDDEDEYGGERRRKRRKARHHNRPEWTPLQRRRVAGDSPPAKATFMTNILENRDLFERLQRTYDSLLLRVKWVHAVPVDVVYVVCCYRTSSRYYTSTKVVKLCLNLNDDFKSEYCSSTFPRRCSNLKHNSSFFRRSI